MYAALTVVVILALIAAGAFVLRRLDVRRRTGTAPHRHPGRHTTRQRSA